MCKCVLKNLFLWVLYYYKNSKYITALFEGRKGVIKQNKKLLMDSIICYVKDY